MMRGIRKKRFVIALISFIFLFSIAAISQTTEPGDPGVDPSLGDVTPLGGGAPIGSGTIILIGLGVAFGGRKAYKLYHDSKEELKDLQ